MKKLKEMKKEEKKMKRIGLVIVLCVGVFLGFTATSAWALPYMDTGFIAQTPATTPGSPDLVIAREQTKWIAAENTWRQAIYFRFHEGSSSSYYMLGQVLWDPGTLTVSGVDTTATALSASDASWGISGAPYAGFARGLEYPDYQYLDFNGSFNFKIAGGIDDFRLYLDYGATMLSSAYLLLELESMVTSTIPGELGVRVGLPGSGVPGAGYYADDYGIASDGDQHVKIPLVPEPATMLLLGSGLLGLAGLRRKRRKA